MRFFTSVIAGGLALIISTTCGWADDEKFNSEQMLNELEKQLQLSQEKLAKLKPSIDEKSVKLKKAIHESVDKGFVQLEEMTEKLDSVSKDAEQKMQEFLNSEEMAKLKNYLKKIDEDAIQESKEQIIAELTAILALTEQQVKKFKPILEDGLKQLSEMLDTLVKEGNKSLEAFKRDYDELSKEMRDRLKKQLDDEQMDKLEKYNEDRKDKIEQTLFTT